LIVSVVALVVVALVVVVVASVVVLVVIAVAAVVAAVGHVRLLLPHPSSPSPSLKAEEFVSGSEKDFSAPPTIT